MRAWAGIAGTICLIFAAAAETGPARAADGYTDSVSFANLGGVGLLETRTARVLPDGEIAVGGSYSDPLASYFLTWQATPWLELTARYSEAWDEPDDLDRGLDLKVRLFDEGDFLPAAAVGFQDVLGSGPYSGEYLVFSRRVNAFDVSFGFAWGYPATRGGIDNPLKMFSGSFRSRNDNIDRNGVPAFKNFFSGGRMGVFGGIEYMTAIRGLTVKVEYNGGDARTVPLAEPIEDDFPVNAGINYRPLSWLNLAAGFVRGDTLAVGLSLRTSLHDLMGLRKRHAAPPVPANGSTASAHAAGAPGSSATGPKITGKVPVVIVPEQPADGGINNTGRLTVCVTKALFDAGLGGALVELEGGRANVTLSLPPEEAGAKSLQAAYIALSNLPRRFDAVRLRNRFGDEVGQEGQLYSRRTVESFARVDAAFNDLLAAGGVSGVNADGETLTVEMTARHSGPIAAGPAAAAADLLPGADAVEIRQPLGAAEIHEAGALRSERTREHLARYLGTAGFTLEALSGDAGAYYIRVQAEGRFGDVDINRAIDGAEAVLVSSGQRVERVSLTVMRGGIEVARAERPDTVETVEEDAAREDEEGAAPTGMRYLPLFGVVEWGEGSVPGAGAERQPRRRMAASTRTLTEGEAARLKKAVKAQGLRPLGWRVTEDGAEVAVANDRFASPATVVGRAARALTDIAPGDVEWLGVTTMARHEPLSDVQLFRRDVDSALDYAGSPEEIWLNTEIAPGDGVDEDKGWKRFGGGYPHFAWAVYPEIKQHFGNGADGGYKAEGLVTLAGEVELLPGLAVSAAFTRDIYGDLDKVPAGPGVSTPRVRSDIARYVEEGENAVSRAIVDYVLRPVDDVYVRASAGLYEPMFGGAGVEALYRPQHDRYAIGVKANWVKQRDFDQLLGFRDYTVWTGHVSLYRDWTRLGLESVVSIGRYLAGDWGGSIDVYRRFENGMRLGAWLSVTDMPRSEFGRDTFAKGLYLAIPLDLFLPWSLRRDVTVEARALNRDGGQRLERGQSLYELTRPGTERGLRTGWPDLLN